MLTPLAAQQDMIEKGDNLTVTLKGVEPQSAASFSGNYLVGESGSIRLPFLKDDIPATGLKAEALARRIEKALVDAEIFTTPRISVFANRADIEPRALTVTVGGHVKKSGRIPFRPNLTAEQAIIASGDFDVFGSKKRVRLTRDGREFLLDLTTRAGRLTKLLPNDTLRVDQKRWNE